MLTNVRKKTETYELNKRDETNIKVIFAILGSSLEKSLSFPKITSPCLIKIVFSHTKIHLRYEIQKGVGVGVGEGGNRTKNLSLNKWNQTKN